MTSPGLISRWTAFNLVGLAGFVVQLALVGWLVHTLHVHYLVATALAVEAAVLHNFAWHQRWTWRDRPAVSRKAVATRLWRFHLLNGAMSLVGNVALVALFTGVLGLPVVVANILAVLVCSAVNFAASETAVFRSATTAALALSLLGSPSAADAAQDADAISGWNAYQATVDSRYAAASSDRAFFVSDVAAANRWRERARQGDPQLVEVQAPAVRDGKIHHWVGAVWVPGVSVDQVVERLKAQAGTESQSYDDVVASKLLSRDGDTLRVYMKLRRTAIVTVTYNTEHLVQYRRLGETRASSRSVATRIAELQDVGGPNEREKRPGEDNGFLWRLNAYWRYEQVPGGVLIECESVSLSRPVPFLLRPIASPIVDRIARDSLERTLTSLRRVLTAR